jgi:hypothetical protein
VARFKGQRMVAVVATTAAAAEEGCRRRHRGGDECGCASRPCPRRGCVDLGS